MAPRADSVSLFLCGDVMLGRGIDQVLPNPSDPVLYESAVHDAREYVDLAEHLNGVITLPVGFDYVWGDALAEFARRKPDARIVNLETSVTTRNTPEAKGINYRMNPANLPCLKALAPDCCALANNHVLDWGEDGLVETLDALHAAGIRTAGAGRTLEEAQAPVILDLPGGRRALVYSFAFESSGVPAHWAAQPGRGGVCLLADTSPKTLDQVGTLIDRERRPGDVVVASLHWGGNWGYKIPGHHRLFARALIDAAGVDLVHGHSSHHALGIEVYRKKLVLYGCGDFINDYEGIGGYADYRGELPVMYFPRLDPGSGELQSLDLVPLRIERFRLRRAEAADVDWIAAMFNGEGVPFHTGVRPGRDGALALRW